MCANRLNQRINVAVRQNNEALRILQELCGRASDEIFGIFRLDPTLEYPQFVRVKGGRSRNRFSLIKVSCAEELTQGSSWVGDGLCWLWKTQGKSPPDVAEHCLSGRSDLAAGRSAAWRLRQELTTTASAIESVEGDQSSLDNLLSVGSIPEPAAGVPGH